MFTFGTFRKLQTMAMTIKLQKTHKTSSSEIVIQGQPLGIDTK